jgi:hypothetical protein
MNRISKVFEISQFYLIKSKVSEATYYLIESKVSEATYWRSESNPNSNGNSIVPLLVNAPPLSKCFRGLCT